MPEIQIEYLAHHISTIPIIAGWFSKEWGNHYKENNISYISEKIHKRTNINSLPLTLIAIENKEIIGTVNLKKHDMSTRDDLSPWLGGLYVRIDKRNQGIGTQLIEATITKARKMKFHQLYLWTHTARNYYLGLEWEHIGDTEYEGSPASVFKKQLL